VRLDWLCDIELTYRGGFTLVRPYGSEEGAGYGEGDGRASGPRLAGSLRWVNHPRRRSDQTMLPDAHGLITTNDGQSVIFTFSGRTGWVGDTGVQVLSVTFESEAADYLWLNSAMHVLEGVIDAETLVMQAKVYTLVHELTAVP
jgi:hypothetical protein